MLNLLSAAVGGCSCVGMAGASLGGGIGFYSGFYGAISDSLASVEMVLASGALITASKAENSDLFWAVKGAGANFGVVTSLTFEIYDSPNAGQVMNADMTFPISQNGTLWAFANSWVGKQPKELSISFSMAFDSTTQQVCPRTFHSRSPLTKPNFLAPHSRKHHLRGSPIRRRIAHPTITRPQAAKYQHLLPPLERHRRRRRLR
jgi:hypothetical protein